MDRTLWRSLFKLLRIIDYGEALSAAMRCRPFGAEVSEAFRSVRAYASASSVCFRERGGVRLGKPGLRPLPQPVGAPESGGV